MRRRRHSVVLRHHQCPCRYWLHPNSWPSDSLWWWGERLGVRATHFLVGQEESCPWLGTPRDKLGPHWESLCIVPELNELRDHGGVGSLHCLRLCLYQLSGWKALHVADRYIEGVSGTPLYSGRLWEAPHGPWLALPLPWEGTPGVKTLGAAGHRLPDHTGVEDSWSSGWWGSDHLIIQGGGTSCSCSSSLLRGGVGRWSPL